VRWTLRGPQLGVDELDMNLHTHDTAGKPRALSMRRAVVALLVLLLASGVLVHPGAVSRANARAGSGSAIATSLMPGLGAPAFEEQVQATAGLPPNPAPVADDLAHSTNEQCAPAGGLFAYGAATACAFAASGSSVAIAAGGGCAPGYALSGGNCLLIQYQATYSCGASAAPLGTNCIAGNAQAGGCPGGYYLAAPQACCPAGDGWSGTVCTTLSWTQTYSCPGGYVLTGTNCTAYSYGGAVCQYGYYQAAAGACCPNGYALSGASCLPPSYAPVYSCPAGYWLSGAFCMPVNYVQSYSCPAGYAWSGASCVPPTYYQTYSYAPTYACGPGYGWWSEGCGQYPSGTGFSVWPIGPRGRRCWDGFFGGC